MSRIWKSASIAALAITVCGVSATAVFGQSVSERQDSGVTIYRDSFYRGPAAFVGEAKPNMGLAWPVNSIRVHRGSWDLCERPNYQGQCLTFTRDTTILGSPDWGMTVQSIRPTGGGLIGVEADNRILRGKYAEFHTQPESRGYRIPACPAGRLTSSCIRRTADAYCRTVGWSHSASSKSETVGRRSYLADVLCENNKG